MASRPSSRSGGGRRLLAAALIVTIVVVVIDASLKSRSPAPAQTLSGQAWIDDVLPIIGTSTTEGREITQIRTQGLGMPADQINATMGQAAGAAQRTYRSVLALKVPTGAGGAPGLLQACLLVRAQAAQAAAAAMAAALRAGTPPAAASDPEVQALATAGQDFAVADRAYQLFAAAVPKALGITMPASTWVNDPTVWDAGGIQVYLVALRNGTSSTPVHQLAIRAISTNPPPVGTTASVQQIAPTTGLTVTVVVADTGNQAERNLTITAAVAPSAPGRTSQVRDFANLAPGGSYATTIGPISPASGAPSVLTVSVTPPAGSPTPAVTRTLQIEVAAPPPPSTTTTVPATSTTIPATGTTSTTAQS